MDADTRLRCIFHLPSSAAWTYVGVGNHDQQPQTVRAPPLPPNNVSSCFFLPRQSLSPCWGPRGGRALEQEPKHLLLIPAWATASKPTQRVTSSPRICFHGKEQPSQPCPRPKTQILISSHPCPAWPHLSPGPLVPGCTALQVAGLGGSGFPGQACTLGLLHSLLATSPIRPDAVDRAGLGATSAGG